MADLLDAQTLAAVDSAMKDLVDTFFKTVVTVNHRVPTLQKYGEILGESNAPHDFNALVDFSVGEDGRYKNIKQGPMGQELQDGYVVLLWKAEVDAVPLVIDPEQDTITISGKEYHIRMFSPAAGFGSLGNLFYHIEIHYEKGTFPST